LALFRVSWFGFRIFAREVQNALCNALEALK